MTAPKVPSNSTESRARSLVSVDLSGGASTSANDELTVGDTSLAKAYKGAFTADPRSAAGRSSASTLLEAYARERQRQREATDMAKAGVWARKLAAGT